MDSASNKDMLLSKSSGRSNMMNRKKSEDDCTTTTPTIRAKLVPPTSLQECGKRLREGKLVAFPTETVYGLGCNAMDEEAIRKVFAAKERPFTDPLISHVANRNHALELWNATTTTMMTNEETLSLSLLPLQLERSALLAMTESFWPGPFTLVAKAASHVPSILMAGTGYCACRSPQHPLALQLIDMAGVPIAAPSANKFGHVSPTRSQHVWDDLRYEDVWILQENEEECHTSSANVDVCKIGVESSVAKIEMMDDYCSSSATDDATTLSSTTTTLKKGRITLLRQGAISMEDIQDCLRQANLLQYFDVVSQTQKVVATNSGDNNDHDTDTTTTISHVAPGQTLRHYSPNIPSFMVSSTLYSKLRQYTNEELDSLLSKTVIIDFGGILQTWGPYALSYYDLSASGDSSIATRKLFDTLRWAEQVPDAERILFPQLVCDETVSSSSFDALTLALKDRLTRAASGIIIDSLLLP